ncbi:KAT8 regulatory NSL complex subunit 2 [Contarinia nasturtii]|uniref:KAT8 regulatory NSL complex subunit 2 n=1 Tax=Contarinia nasturtii TaxID=265458 RepID=UPI0012D3B9BF|nr:KAT8 regulatory NSL complex subunit 2 [Contarinia nasturtii]XP_031641251.1 KAT8 regulatory NSL complex subunit 2 [Contarinia nasturtii]XP_031641252.1 KAT8 regulatory NSL complex subunit 2 [Contarinia nasturtii]
MSTQPTIVTKNLNRNGGLKIRTPPKITAQQEKDLRDQLHAEIANKTKACSNIAYECSLPRIDGYEYCIRHILQDPTAPYLMCTFLLTNGKRCLQPAPKYDPKKDVLTSYCFEHSRLAQLTKTRTSIGKFKAVDTNDTILNELTHHLNLSKTKNLINNVNSSNITVRSPYDGNDVDQRDEKPVIDPFIDVNAASINTSGRKILDYASDSSSDLELPTLNNTWRGQDLDNSDNESVDSQNEDFLKHAEVYTTELVTKITTEKLMRLRALYIDQLYRLKHLLREKRRNYLHTLRTERETLCSIHEQTKDTISERKIYEKLKALNKYQRRNGVEAILHKKFLEKRQKSRDGVLVPSKPSFHMRCVFTEGGVKCGDRIIPSSKYCRKHILEDKKQVLFRACNIEKAGVICKEPMPGIFEDTTCTLHIQLPPQRNYSQKKYESDSDEETISEFNSTNIKKEDTNETEKSQMDSSQVVSAIEFKIEAKEEPKENSIPNDADKNVTICHDTSEHKPADIEIKTEITDVQPMEH